MATILDKIVDQKRIEIQTLYEQFDFHHLCRTAKRTERSFYQKIARFKTLAKPFFIAEFKRKSPSEGWINRDVALADQVRSYAAAGAAAISVLTDTHFFGGSYADLQTAADTVRTASRPKAPLLLQKDFVLDPIQVYLARLHGADIILLIAAILSPERLLFLKQTAEQLGMGVLVEVHDQAELAAIQHLDFPVLGINNRDLKTFRTALNRTNMLARQAGGRFIIAESGIRDYRDFQVLKNADGFLIGTSLMQTSDARATTNLRSLQPKLLFKACGIRTAALLNCSDVDFIGINFSPRSRRRIDPAILATHPIPQHAVAVFYENTEEEIREVLARFPFRIVQLYAGDVSPEFVQSLKQKVYLSCRVREQADLDQLELYAADVDMFILDGAVPGSGQGIAAPIPKDFPYPFLLAGGLQANNLEAALQAQPNCVGVDIASGIETAGQVDGKKIEVLAGMLQKRNAEQQQTGSPFNAPGVPAVH
jgi:indole-3-glycerol phosphate synthase/phosphoribosylanthranilate isomerase